MPKLADDASGGVPEWPLSSGFEMDTGELSRLVLSVLSRLCTEFPSHVDLSGCDALREHGKDFERLWKWLETQQIVNGPLSNCSMTLAGQKSFHEALHLASESTQKMLHSEDGLDGSEANSFVLSVLRQHYQNHVSRIRNR